MARPFAIPPVADIELSWQYIAFLAVAYFSPALIVLFLIKSIISPLVWQDLDLIAGRRLIGGSAPLSWLTACQALTFFHWPGALWLRGSAVLQRASCQT